MRVGACGRLAFNTCIALSSDLVSATGHAPFSRPSVAHSSTQDSYNTTNNNNFSGGAGVWRYPFIYHLLASARFTSTGALSVLVGTLVYRILWILSTLFFLACMPCQVMGGLGMN
ncbi:hypothetical protein BDV95DRAFT_79612 [Massariosphaeria phaeospora]|uniref:Uncharacterized protein n=1 Tax=Massariosphaeria phaeospora TaxID=100035 RepID=A0A7C8MAC3_9PLEO|nr:hypothetical protein BDV95DRAFT_79612 [Massariosphaeria phaeospora]